MELRLRDELLTGHDEALMTYRGVTSDRELETGAVIVDIGGGSTELVAGEPTACGGTTASTSAPCG